MKRIFAAAAVVLLSTLGAAHEPLPPGYGELGYALPAPGSYRLPPLGRAADGEVLDTRGETRSLGALLDGRVTVLSFIYQSCHDTSGCPLATTVLHRIRQDTAREPELAERLRLISLSFDPDRDTPEHMAHLAHNFRFVEGGSDWLFLTTASQEKLQPILDAYGQAMMRERGPDGEETGDLAHVLRVFLIDSERRIRNIYSPSFLHPDLVLNDVRTLFAEAGPDPAHAPAHTAHAATAGPGDDKTGYERPDYRTRSLSLAVRRGRPMDLLANLQDPPLGLPPVPVPADAPVTQKTVAIGRKLFFDRRLSLNGTFSCAMCHIPEQGFASNELKTAVGIEGRTVRRNAPGLFNAAYSAPLFHDGRETRLEHQVWEPLLAANEMGNPSIASVVEKVRRLPDYRGLFEDAFGRGPDMETIGQALASYERTLNCGDSPFDRWYYGGEPSAIGDAVERGFAVFMGKGGCVGCHLIGPEHALFTDGRLHNTGIGYAASMAREPTTRRIQVAPGVALDVAAALIGKVSEAPPSDLGRYEITRDPDDRWKYKTPGLRNLTLTAPYMHDGSIATLAEVVAFYDGGGVENPLLDPSIRRLDLSAREQTDLVAFLEALTGRCDDLVADAFAAPVGDASADDPPWWE
ncbi:cytochrome c peroxidase [Thiocapsa roseopersicina]|uniref:Methylamine utilization protein MauG n=1 Tax=Thiocapsa roseopersicina TaxID=1058 RepID=A0A1H2RYW3_THIRO|nr:cytochrome c peroxidase [Thiocapsa roseopersicina]SDW24488.1 cytochrome c peroxidase [Thiocapsa roseopersicina]